MELKRNISRRSCGGSVTSMVITPARNELSGVRSIVASEEARQMTELGIAMTSGADMSLQVSANLTQTPHAGSIGLNLR